jgi:CRISPR/Cas system CSM-associated protein Csm2 small subunit
MNYQPNQNANSTINLDALSNDQLNKLMSDIPKIIKKRKAKADKELQTKLSKEAKSMGYKVRFEKIPRNTKT